MLGAARGPPLRLAWFGRLWAFLRQESRDTKIQNALSSFPPHMCGSAVHHYEGGHSPLEQRVVGVCAPPAKTAASTHATPVAGSVALPGRAARMSRRA